VDRLSKRSILRRQAPMGRPRVRCDARASGASVRKAGPAALGPWRPPTPRHRCTPGQAALATWPGAPRGRPPATPVWREAGLPSCAGRRRAFWERSWDRRNRRCCTGSWRSKASRRRRRPRWRRRTWRRPRRSSRCRCCCRRLEPCRLAWSLWGNTACYSCTAPRPSCTAPGLRLHGRAADRHGDAAGKQSSQHAAAGSARRQATDHGIEFVRVHVDRLLPPVRGGSLHWVARTPRASICPCGDRDSGGPTRCSGP
jgi:hypothetical protein